MKETKIQWTDHTVNFWMGCKKISAGCKYCYMYRDKEMYGQDPFNVVRVSQKTIDKNLKDAKAGDMIFTCSWSDFFIEEGDSWREEAWDIIRKNKHLNWQILTKRPERIIECLPEDWGEGWDHVWLGVSVENQLYMNRVEILAKVPAKIRFISFEPLIGKIDVTPYLPELEDFHWCIIGGESGNEEGKYQYRECRLEWIEKIIQDLSGSKVKVFVKQTGTHLAKQLKLTDKHGGRMEEWPAAMQIREFPGLLLVNATPNPVEETDRKTEFMNENELLKTTPVIPDDVYKDLPAFILEAVQQFPDQRERDVVLTSCLVVLSGCFCGCSGKYDAEWVSSNLFGFIVAPPASRKGVMKFARMLGKPIDESFKTANGPARQNYEVVLKAWMKNSKKNPATAGPSPVKPKFPLHFIPGNSSAAAIYKMLDESNGVGTICESEADTLSGAIKQDWGNFSHLLRGAFHHDDLSMSRSSNDTYISISNPRLSTLLTGTPDQVTRLISSADDGLCSRFLYYAYSRELEWKDPMPKPGGIDLTGFFLKKGAEVEALKKILDANQPVFNLSEDQFRALNENFKAKLERIKAFEGEGAASAVFRLGIIAFRIAMILTILRNAPNIASLKEVSCADVDFEITMGLVDVYFQHAMVIYSTLPKQSKRFSNPVLGRFYELLPCSGSFPRKKANEIGKEMKISEKSVGNYLAELKKNKLVKSDSYGTFEKLKVA
ncbi:MAG: DUF5131 family protein [Chitinophagales bacterium]|nr:DUF5131 family protein [Chitinophagales bacterium]